MSAGIEAEPRPGAETGHAAQSDSEPASAAQHLADTWRRLRERTTRRSLLAALIVFAAALLFWYCCWIQDNPWLVNSDAATIALQGWDFGHGNPLLRHWITGDASFYTFETPLYALVERIMGLRATTVHVVSALTYTLVMLATAWLVKGDERGMRAWARFGLVTAFLAVPAFHGLLTPTLMGPPDHIGTAVFMLLSYLLCDRASGRRGATWCLFALLVLGQLGDATVKYVGALPIVLVCLSRPLLARKLRSPDLWMAFAAAASIPGEAILRAALRTWGAYSMTPPRTQMADSSVWLRNIRTTLRGLLTLFNIPTSTPTAPYWSIAAVLGGLVLLAGVYGFARTLLRWPRAATADQLLAVGIPVYLAAFAFSTMAAPGVGGAYDFLGIIPMIVALAARNLPLPAPGHREPQPQPQPHQSQREPQLQPHQSQREPQPQPQRRLPLLLPAVAAGAGIAAVALFATGFKPGQIGQRETIGGWLRTHGLKYGIAQYWDAAAVTVDSGNAVGVRAVIQVSPRQYAVYAWVTNTAWYDPAAHDARFFIADESVTGFHAADAEAAYGKPQAIYQVAGKEILVYRTNLLRTLIQVQPPNF